MAPLSRDFPDHLEFPGFPCCHPGFCRVTDRDVGGDGWLAGSGVGFPTCQALKQHTFDTCILGDLANNCPISGRVISGLGP